jgi:DNA repair protein RadC
MLSLMVKCGRRYRQADKSEVLAAAAKYMIADVHGSYVNDPQMAKRAIKQCIGTRESEVFCCLWLNSRHRIIAFEEIFYGTIDQSAVWPREVVKTALARNAAAVVFAHNHPSGDASPSRADELITLRLRDALALVDVRVIDHLVVAGEQVSSLAERGVI